MGSSEFLSRGRKRAQEAGLAYDKGLNQAQEFVGRGARRAQKAAARAERVVKRATERARILAAREAERSAKLAKQVTEEAARHAAGVGAEANAMFEQINQENAAKARKTKEPQKVIGKEEIVEVGIAAPLSYAWRLWKNRHKRPTPPQQ